MKISEQKRLITKFYLISLLLNVVIPLMASYIIVGDSTGEIQFLFIGAIFWASVNTLSYCTYFLIPGFESKRDKIATLFFPSILLFGLFLAEIGLMPAILYSLAINLIFFLYYNWKKNKV